MKCYYYYYDYDYIKFWIESIKTKWTINQFYLNSKATYSLFFNNLSNSIWNSMFQWTTAFLSCYDFCCCYCSTDCNNCWNSADFWRLCVVVVVVFVFGLSVMKRSHPDGSNTLTFHYTSIYSASVSLALTRCIERFSSNTFILRHMYFYLHQP